MSLVGASQRRAAAKWAGRSIFLILPLSLLGALPIKGDLVSERSKRIIGATATIKEASSGLPFAARIDTGARSCSIHVEKWEIKDPEKRPARNVGKPIRFLLKNEDGESQWVETLVAARVQMRSSVQDQGDYHGRYKVLLTLQWEDVKKEVLVTLNDRTNMDYPLLIGRNFLRDDFLVDVDVDNGESATD
jgi:hypothetical protein